MLRNPLSANSPIVVVRALALGADSQVPTAARAASAKIAVHAIGKT